MKVQKHVVILAVCIMAAAIVTVGTLFAGCENEYARLLSDEALSNRDNNGGTGDEVLPGPTLYSITVVPSASGKITASKTQAAAGDTVYLTVEPDAGCRLKSNTLRYNGVSILYSTAFTMPLLKPPLVSVTVSGEFETIPADAPQYNIAVAGGITNGTVTPSKAQATAGEIISVTIQPDANYRLKEGTLNYSGMPILGTAFIMPSAGVIVTGEFEAIPDGAVQYPITVTQSANGAIAAGKARGMEGEIISLTITPAMDYRLKSGTLNYNGVSIPGAAFIMPAARVTVSGEFEVIPVAAVQYPVTVTQSAGGTIIPSRIQAGEGETVYLSIQPDYGRRLKNGTLQFNGTAITGSTTFIMPAVSVNVTGEFEAIPADAPKYDIAVMSSTNGAIAANPTGTQAAAEGEIIALAIAPIGGYQLRSGTLNYNGISIQGTAFIMPAADITITGMFEAIPAGAAKYNVAVAGGITHGTITANPTGTAAAAAGEIISLIITPATDYRLQSGTLNYNGVSIPGGTAFIMPAANVTVSGMFEAVPGGGAAKYNIAVAVGITNGTITANPTGTAAAAAGEIISLTITPAGGYQLKSGSLNYNGVSIPGTAFIMPAANITVGGEFEAADSGISVAVSPDTLTLRRTGATGHLTATVLPSGTSQGVTWSSSNSAVATVAANGVVTATGSGEAVITAASSADPSKTGTCTVKVLSTAGSN
jgi:hypothetical protein